MNRIELENEQQDKYIKFLQDKYPHIDLKSVELFTDGKNIYFKAQNKKRVLAKMGGTYIGHPDNWNNAKQAEFRDTLTNILEDLILLPSEREAENLCKK